MQEREKTNESDAGSVIVIQVVFFGSKFLSLLQVLFRAEKDLSFQKKF
jgi:hypothetical protein